MSYAVLTSEAHPDATPAALAGKKVAITGISSDVRIAAERLGRSELVRTSGMDEVVGAVCDGRADAGLLTMNAFASVMVSDCPVGALRLFPIEGADFWFGVGANRDRPDAVRAAGVLAGSIAKLAADGTLAAIDFRWNTKL